MSRNTSKSQNSGVLAAVLKAFIPYTKENLMLATKPNKFFNHLEYLERETGSSNPTLRVTISRAKRAGLLKVNKDGQIVTTWRGKLKVSVVPGRKTRQYLVIIFDIPERFRKSRDVFRQYLSMNYCHQVQKSVWKTNYDIYDELKEVIADLNISEYVTFFMADQINDE